jgi:hypothetical protein
LQLGIGERSNMKILLCSPNGDGIWYGLRLLQAGHDVSWIAKHSRDKDSLQGLIPPPIESIGNPADYDLIVYDFCDDGKVADQLRELTPVIGSSELLPLSMWTLLSPRKPG